MRRTHVVVIENPRDWQYTREVRLAQPLLDSNLKGLCNALGDDRPYLFKSSWDIANIVGLHEVISHSVVQVYELIYYRRIPHGCRLEPLAELLSEQIANYLTLRFAVEIEQWCGRRFFRSDLYRRVSIGEEINHLSEQWVSLGECFDIPKQLAAAC